MDVRLFMMGFGYRLYPSTRFEIAASHKKLTIEE